MSNIHGMSDFNNNERARLNANRAGMSMFYLNSNEQNSQKSQDPRGESFFYALKVNFCSTLKLKSFISIFILISIFFFALQRIIDGIQIPGELLQIKIDGKYTSHLDLNYSKLQIGQIWRLLTFFLGFLDMNQWVSITIMSLFFGTMVESVHGVKICIGKLYFFI